MRDVGSGTGRNARSWDAFFKSWTSLKLSAAFLNTMSCEMLQKLHHIYIEKHGKLAKWNGKTHSVWTDYKDVKNTKSNFKLRLRETLPEGLKTQPKKFWLKLTCRFDGEHFAVSSQSVCGGARVVSWTECGGLEHWGAVLLFQMIPCVCRSRVCLHCTI